MNKTELIEKVAEIAEIDKATASKAVAATFATISSQLAADDKVSLIGFGTFETRTRAAREGRNPQTGESIKIKASKAPAFRAGKALKDAVNAPKKKAKTTKSKKK